MSSIFASRLAAAAALPLMISACTAEPTNAEPPQNAAATGGNGASGALAGTGGASGSGMGGSAAGGMGGGAGLVAGGGGGAGNGGSSGAGGAAAGGISGSAGGGVGGIAGGPQGGAGAGGVAGAGGIAGADGGLAGGGASGSAGSGGATAGAAGASGGGSGGGSSKSGVMPSAGCGKSSGTPMNVNVPNAIVTFPDGYDGSTPVPMMFGFHGAGRTHQEFQTVDARMVGTDLEENFAMVYLKAAGSGWASSDKSRLDTAYDQMVTDHCIDLNRVFATGHSSGAHFIEILLCDGDERLSAVALVAGSKQCDSWDAAVPSMLIHGTNDQERVSLGDANGQQELAPFVTSNQCDTSTTPYAGVMACNSMYNQAAVDNGCVAYDGCSQPFVFCSHDDQNYSGTNHGWPCFANQTMFAFLGSL